MARLKKEDVKQLSEPIIIEAGILGDKEYTVEKKQSEFRRCDEYCEVSKFCSIKLARGNK